MTYLEPAGPLAQTPRRMPTFETEEAVRLRVGGPVMEVVEDQSHLDPPLVYCTRDTELGYQQEGFHPEELVRVDEAGPPDAPGH